ncbi:hypothetical protein D516_2290 [Rhodobacter sp. AKP1]|nr:hypothetical protein D516_2290 [Rhodobacter sp. AKP1]
MGLDLRHDGERAHLHHVADRGQRSLDTDVEDRPSNRCHSSSHLRSLPFGQVPESPRILRPGPPVAHPAREPAGRLAGLSRLRRNCRRRGPCPAIPARKPILRWQRMRPAPFAPPAPGSGKSLCKADPFLT